MSRVARRRWPSHLFGGRMRTSTAVLIVAFVLVNWLYQSVQPDTPQASEAPATAVVPPGFVPDPNYTWVPRTQVAEPTTRRPRPTTTAPTTTTSPTVTETTTTTPAPPTTTVVDPDGPGPLPAQTRTVEPPPTTTTAVPGQPPTPTSTVGPVPNQPLQPPR